MITSLHDVEAKYRDPFTLRTCPLCSASAKDFFFTIDGEHQGCDQCTKELTYKEYEAYDAGKPYEAYRCPKCGFDGAEWLRKDADTGEVLGCNSCLDDVDAFNYNWSEWFFGSEY